MVSVGGHAVVSVGGMLWLGGGAVVREHCVVSGGGCCG